MDIDLNEELSENMQKMGSVQDAIDELRAGRLVLVVDDPDRENEGDLICAAEFATQ